MTELDPLWLGAIVAHVRQESEASLSEAYDLGRQALRKGLGILDVFMLYEAVQAELVLTAPAAEQPRLAAAIGDFFRELLSAYEMSLRGYREANRELERVNLDLKQAYTTLKSQQAQLVQSAKMASLGELVAGVAHEVNNPLAFIVSHLRTASASVAKIEAELPPPLPATVQSNLKRAQDRLRESELGAERIQDLVLKLRTFSRLDEGARKPVSVRDSVASILTILEHRFASRIEVRTSFGQPDVIECMPALLNQALMNLVSNAVDAIEGEGTIWIESGASGSDYVISVSDSGHGIPESLRERVLEPFFTTKPVGTGTGLGLSITYSIVEAHRGSFELGERPGGGTIATIRFPLEQS